VENLKSALRVFIIRLYDLNDHIGMELKLQITLYSKIGLPWIKPVIQSSPSNN